jgi:hypothetical protein
MSTTDTRPSNTDDYALLSEEQKSIIEGWVQKRLTPAYVSHMSTFGLRQQFEKSDMGFPVTNGQLIGAMLACGYKIKSVVSGSNAILRPKDT